MAFPPPPVTFPATRLSSCNVSDIAPVWLITSSGRHPFLSEQPRLAFRFALASLSASTPSVLDSGIPLLLSSNGASPPPSHLSMPVKMPVSNLDCEAILHPLFSMSSRKYFNYYPYFTGLRWISCGKPASHPVDKNVGNTASGLASRVIDFDVVGQCLNTFANDPQNSEKNI